MSEGAAGNCHKMHPGHLARARRHPPLAGSVINVQGVALPGNVVHVRTAKGRTVGAARTDSGGVNVVTVPARSAIVLDTQVRQ